MAKKKKTLCYRFFNKPGNLEEALEKARRNGNRVEIKIWTASVEGIDHYYGRITSGRFGSLYFRPCYNSLTGPNKEECREKYKHKALAVKKWFEKQGMEVNILNKY